MDHEPRALCLRCMRPTSVCWCAHLPSIPARTRVVILQHPRERYVAIGTGRMTALCLTGASLHLGVDFEHDAQVRAAVSDPERPAALLWPGEGAIDITESPPEGPITLVVIDGTWSTAKKVVRTNPFLASLPRYAFKPPAPSAYRIRREPRADYVSTIEAVAHVLTILEGDAFQPMLAPFLAMIEAQLDHEKRLQGSRHRHRKKREVDRPSRLPAALGCDNLVCVTGEANAWPYRAHERGNPPDELVQWVARRLATGETFEAVIAPRQPLAPSTPLHIRIPEARLAAGESFESFAARWRAFVRDDDVICAWGYYATRLLLEEGGYLPAGYLDLRKTLGDLLKTTPGSIDDVGAKLGFSPSPPLFEGRAGERLARVCDVTQHLAGLLRRHALERKAPRSSSGADAAG